jgi:hypothetical protein
MLDAAQHLIEQVGHSLVVEVHLYNLTQVRVHKLHNEIYILKVFKCALRCKRI